MKRVAENSNQLHLVGEDASYRLKYQRLLEDYLEVQKEFVSKKKKLQMAKQKREILLAEVGFLRRRHNFLIRSRELEAKQGLVRPEYSSAQSCKNENHSVDEASPNNLPPVQEEHPILGDAHWDSEKKPEDILNPLRAGKQLKNHAH